MGVIIPSGILCPIYVVKRKEDPTAGFVPIPVVLHQRDLSRIAAKSWRLVGLRGKWGKEMRIGFAALLCLSLESVRGCIRLSRSLIDFEHSNLCIGDGHTIISAKVRLSVRFPAGVFVGPAAIGAWIYEVLRLPVALAG